MFRNLILASAVALALPGSALAAAVPASVAGPLTVDEEAGKATFTISCGTTATVPPLPDIGSTGQINYTTSSAGPNAAGENSDYTKTMGSVNCAPAAAPGSTVTVDVPILPDTLDEPNQSFTFTITAGAFSGTISPTAAAAVTSIVDNDVPIATIATVASVAEGNEGATNANFAVTLSQPSWQAVTIPFSTADYNATAGADYTATSGNLSIPAGQTTGTISVPVLGDTIDEPVEGFFVNLGTPTNAALDNTKKQGIGVIGDDDAPPVPEFSLGPDVRVTEGNEGTVNAIFTVTLSPAATGRTQVAWKTGNWTATLGDYGGAQGILVFEAGETTKTIEILVKGDRRKEPVEVFGVLLEGPVGGVIKKAGALGIIVDDDTDAPPPATNGPKVDIARPTRDGKSLLTLLTCPGDATACKGTLVLTAGALKVGKAKFDIAKGLSTELKVKLSLKARRALRKRSLRVTFTAVARDTAGAVGTATKTFKVKKTRRRQH